MSLQAVRELIAKEAPVLSIINALNQCDTPSREKDYLMRQVRAIYERTSVGEMPFSKNAPVLSQANNPFLNPSFRPALSCVADENLKTVRKLIDKNAPITEIMKALKLCAPSREKDQLIREIRASLESSASQKTNLETEIETLQEQLSEKKLQLSRERAQGLHYRKEIARLEEIIRQLKEDLRKDVTAACEKEVASNYEKLKGFEERIEELETNFASKNRELEEARRELEEARQRQKEDILPSDHLQNLEETLIRSTSEIDALKQEKTALTTQIKEQETLINKLQLEGRTVHQSLSELRGQYESLQRGHRDSQTRYDELEQDHIRYTKEAQAQYTKLEEQYNELSENHEALTADLETAREEAKTSEGLNQLTTETLTETEKQLEETQNLLTQTETAFSELVEKKNHIEKQLETTQQNAEQSTQKIEELKEQIRALQKLQSKTEELNPQADDRVTHLQEQIRCLTEDKQDKIRANTQLENHVGTLEKQIKELEEENTQLDEVAKNAQALQALQQQQLTAKHEEYTKKVLEYNTVWAELERKKSQEQNAEAKIQEAEAKTQEAERKIEASEKKLEEKTAQLNKFNEWIKTFTVKQLTATHPHLSAKAAELRKNVAAFLCTLTPLFQSLKTLHETHLIPASANDAFSAQAYLDTCWGNTIPAWVTETVNKATAYKAKTETLNLTQSLNLTTKQPQALLWLSSENDKLESAKQKCIQFLSEGLSLSGVMSSESIAAFFDNSDTESRTEFSPGVDVNELQDPCSQWIHVDSTNKLEIPMMYALNRLELKLAQLQRSQEWILKQWEALLLS